MMACQVHNKPLLIEQAYDYGRVFKRLGVGFKQWLRCQESHSFGARAMSSAYADACRLALFGHKARV